MNTTSNDIIPAQWPNSGETTHAVDDVMQEFSQITPLGDHGINSLWRAKRYGRWFCLKGVAAQRRGDAAVSFKLAKELETLMRLDHTGVARIMGLENVNNLGPCLVMEWIDGDTLGDWLLTHHSAAQQRNVIMQLLDVIDYVHSCGIVHRDLSPTNVMVSRIGNHVKVIDFGLADADNYALFKQAGGTDGFVSPEQRNGGAADVRDDVYSLGCLIELMPVMASRYSSVVARCKAPAEHRYASVALLRRDILRRDARPRRLAIAAAAIITLTVGVALAWNATSSRSDSSFAPVPTSAPLDSTSTITAPGKQQPAAQRTTVDQATAEGIRRLRAGFPSEELRTLLDTISHPRYLDERYAKLCRGGLDIINDYLDELKDDFDDNERSDIAARLFYFNGVELQKINNRIEQITPQ